MTASSLPIPVARVLLALAAAYAAAWVLARVLWFLVVEVAAVQVEPLGTRQLAAFTVSFCAFFLPWLYAIPCMVAGRWLRPDWPRLMLVMGTTFFCALWCEVGANSIFVAVLGRPAWTYHIWPVHHGYTSGVGLVMWPEYGFLVYFLHRALELRPSLRPLCTIPGKALLLAVDAMLLEILANTFSLLVFGSFYFHYHQPDLLHFTTAEIFLPYLAAGLVGLTALERLQRLPPRWHAAMGLVMYAAGVLSLALLQ